MRHIVIFVLTLVAVSSSAQSSRRDSLLNMGRSLRDAKLFVEAIQHFTDAGGDAGRLEIANTRFVMGEFRPALSICDDLLSHESIYSEDAELLIARIRECQGLSRIARFKYKRLINNGNADAAYYFALMNCKTGHNTEAVQLLQKSIQLNRNNIDAHIVLSETLINSGQRYLAMLPLMYSLLYSTDTEGIRESAKQLEALWSNKSHIVLNLSRQKKTYVSEASERAEANITDWIRNSSCTDSRPQTECHTPELLAYLKANQENNLDWWQIVYADFFISICDAGYHDALVHHLCASLDPDGTRSWIESHEGNYAEFLTWLTFQK